MRILLWTLLLLAMPQCVWATACGDSLPKIIRNAYPQAIPTERGYRLPEDHKPHVMTGRDILREEVACAPWPVHRGWTLVAVRLRQAQTDPDIVSADLDVLVVETRSGKILYRLFERNGAETAMSVMDGLDIDTTAWRLNSNVTAFGVMLSQVRDSERLPYRLRTLKLYVVEGDELRRVLADFHVGMERGEKRGACDAWFETHVLTLSRGESASNGMWDWLAHTAVTRRTSTMAGGECRTTEEVRPIRTSKLSYRGRQYYLED